MDLAFVLDTLAFADALPTWGDVEAFVAGLAVRTDFPLSLVLPGFLADVAADAALARAVIGALLLDGDFARTTFLL
jgi:hypothetical protein